MKAYIVHDGDDIDQAFSTRAAAEAYAPGRYVSEHEVYDGEPPTWTYWHRGANVYPDGTFTEWTQEHQARGAVTIPEADDHLNTLDEPWDGHSQGHCGEHVSICGTSREGVEQAFQRALMAAIGRQTGRCLSRFHSHNGAIDGVTVFAADFRQARLAGTGETIELACYPHAEHDYGVWSEGRDVDAHNRNRQRVCSRCCRCEINVQYSSAPTDKETTPTKEGA